MATKTIGGLADAMFELREHKRELEAEVKKVEESIGLIEQELLELLDAQETTRGDGKLATVSVSEAVVPVVKDWDAFWDYVFRSKNTQLLQNRVSAPAWREICEVESMPPGTEPFVKRGIRLTVK
jgi:hypothetical protein